MNKFIISTLAAQSLTLALTASAGVVVDMTPESQRGAVIAELPYQSYFLVGDDAEKKIHCWFPNTQVEVIVTDGDTSRPLEILQEPMLGDYASGFKDPDADATVMIVRSGGRETHWIGLYRIDDMNNATLLAEVEGAAPGNPHVDDSQTVDMYVVEIVDGCPAYIEIKSADGQIRAVDFNGQPFVQ